MWKIQNISLFLLFTLASAIPIQQLNPKKLQSSIKENQFTLVYVYSSSCGYCKQFTPRFQQTAKVNTNLGVVFGKMDGPAFQLMRQKYRVYSYPSVLLFWKNIDYPIAYTKQRTTQGLLEFIKLATKGKVAEIDNNQLKKVPKQDRESGIIFRGPKSSEEYNIFSVMSLVQDYQIFVNIKDSQDITPAVQIKGQNYTDFSFEKLRTIIKTQFAQIHEISEQPWIRIHQKKQPGIIFVDPSNNKKVLKLLQNIVKILPDVVFLRLDPRNQQYQDALTALQIQNQENIFGIVKQADALFQANKPYSQESLAEFVSGFLNLTWPVYLKSQKQGDKYKLTRNNYDQKINANKDIILFLYKSTDQSKNKLLDLFKHLTVRLKNNENLSLLRCNMANNQIQSKLGVAIKKTPYILFFRNRMKDNPITFTQREVSVSSVIQFIMQNTTFDWEDEWSQDL